MISQRSERNASPVTNRFNVFTKTTAQASVTPKAKIYNTSLASSHPHIPLKSLTEPKMWKNDESNSSPSAIVAVARTPFRDQYRYRATSLIESDRKDIPIGKVNAHQPIPNGNRPIHIDDTAQQNHTMQKAQRRRPISMPPAYHTWPATSPPRHPVLGESAKVHLLKDGHLLVGRRLWRLYRGV